MSLRCVVLYDPIINLVWKQSPENTKFVNSSTYDIYLKLLMKTPHVYRSGKKRQVNLFEGTHFSDRMTLVS